MKVVSHGNYYKKVIPICKKCGCRYEINKEDIKKYEKPKKDRNIRCWGYLDRKKILLYQLP